MSKRSVLATKPSEVRLHCGASWILLGCFMSQFSHCKIGPMQILLMRHLCDHELGYKTPHKSQRLLLFFTFFSHLTTFQTYSLSY